MKPWTFEADQIRIDDEFTNQDIVTNDAILEFLEINNQASKFFLVAPKGVGKTLILKLKSTLYRQQKGVIFIPQNETCEKITINSISLSEKDIEFFEKREIWQNIWKTTLTLSILQRTKFELPDILKRKIKNATEISDILNIVLRERSYFLYQGGFELMPQILVPELRKINSSIVIFLDSLDQTIAQTLNLQYKDTSNEKKTTAISFWSNSQLGLLYAINDISVSTNRHIKIFATIRSEAFRLDKSDMNLQIRSYCTFLRYEKILIKKIFLKNIEQTESLKLSKPNSNSLLESFIGYETMPHSFVKKQEDVFEFIYRHTFGRPREVVLIGEAIYKMSPETRTFNNIRYHVNKISHDVIFEQFQNEIIPTFDTSQLELFCNRLKGNVFTEYEIKKLPKTMKVLLSFYYRIGLIGVSKKDRNKNLYYQDFWSHEYNYFENRRLPNAEYFFTHPAMDGLLIDRLSKEYNRNNIIGYKLPFLPPKSSKTLFKLREKMKKRKAKKQGQIHVLIASPYDLGEERKLLKDKLATLFYEKGYEASTNHRIIIRGWEDLASQQGYAQDVINNLILPEIDIVLALFKHKLGTPVIDKKTGKKRSESGTVEELLDAIDNPSPKSPLGMVYFYEIPPVIDNNDIEKSKQIVKELERLQKFKKSLGSEIIYKGFKDSSDLLELAVNDLRKNIETYIK